MAIGAGVLVLLLSPFFRKLMHLDTLKDDSLAGEAEIAEPQAAGVHPGKAN
jgi:POT family proton-dependent oligopeptide transporter